MKKRTQLAVASEIEVGDGGCASVLDCCHIVSSRCFFLSAYADRPPTTLIDLHAIDANLPKELLRYSFQFADVLTEGAEVQILVAIHTPNARFPATIVVVPETRNPHAASELNKANA